MLQHQVAAHSSGVHSAHVVQLFDSDESLAQSVAQFFGEGLLRNDTMLAVMDEERWYSVAMRLSASGCPIDDALRFGRMIVRSADDTLKTFMRRDRPNQPLFNASVGELVSRLAASHRPVRIYGEMVNVLAAQGEYSAAHELEEFWNELGTQKEFRLFCGYSAAHFGDPRNADVLRSICASHTEVISDPQDVLGSFLVSASVQPA
jgi:hypothetical protein